MSCTPTPTATGYATITTFFPSTSFSQSAASPQVTITVRQTCVASGTITGSTIGCVSSSQVTEVYTIGGGGPVAQVPIVVTIPITEALPTETLFAPCTNGGTASTSQSPNPPLTTSVLVASTPPPSTIVEASSATLDDGSVVRTVVTMVTTPPPTSFYVPTSLAGPALQGGSSHPGTSVAPIIGGALGGFFGLIILVGCLWWLCRRRRSWDDIFEKDILETDDAWPLPAPMQSERDRRRVDSSAEPKPYQYGLVGHVVPPAAAGEAPRLSQYGSVSEHSGTHSRSTSHSTAPLLQTARTGSRPSTAGSILTGQTQPGSRVMNPAPRSMSMVSQSSSTRPLPDSLSIWTPNMDELVVLEPPNRTGSPVPATQRRVLQIANNHGPPSPTDAVMPGGPWASSEPPPYDAVCAYGGQAPAGLSRVVGTR